MPTYSYRCTECDDAFDIQQSFTDATLTECPACGGVLRKVFSPVGVSFTGSGFYRNDSRAKPASSGSSESTSAPSAPAKKEKVAATTPSSTSSTSGSAGTSTPS